MQLVIADTGPVNYLILIGHIDILPALFTRVILPSVVRDELAEAPPLVQNWLANLPAWVEIRETSQPSRNVSLMKLDAGEEDAIKLALELSADLLLMDDRDGVSAARRSGLTVTGTLGVLGLAAQHGLLNLADAFTLIKSTNFHYKQATMDALIAEALGVKQGRR